MARGRELTSRAGTDLGSFQTGQGYSEAYIIVADAFFFLVIQHRGDDVNTLCLKVFFLLLIKPTRLILGPSLLAGELLLILR